MAALSTVFAHWGTMSEKDHFLLLAQYNAWMNVKLYEAAAQLPPQELTAERGAFFGSLIGTMNHLVAGDTLWLSRFARHPANHAALDPIRAMRVPAAITEIFSLDLTTLALQRRLLDALILAWVAELSDDEFGHVLHYASTKGVVSNRRLGGLLTHFFNHQTHHRGQCSTLLSQAGVDIGVTDLIMLVPEAAV